MQAKNKADLGGIGSIEKHSTGKSNGFSTPNYSPYRHAVQCSFCGSDYMRFSVGGYCQRCQQRVEYIVREHRATAEKARGARR